MTMNWIAWTIMAVCFVLPVLVVAVWAIGDTIYAAVTHQWTSTYTEDTYG
jgi:uncharacterized membrane protein YjgN (DUF898 family)